MRITDKFIIYNGLMNKL